MLLQPPPEEQSGEDQGDLGTGMCIRYAPTSAPIPDLIGPPIRVHGLCVGLVLNAIQVFMQPIQQESHELLGIMLRIACELAGLARHNGLDAGAKCEHGAPTPTMYPAGEPFPPSLARVGVATDHLQLGRLEGMVGALPQRPE